MVAIVSVSGREVSVEWEDEGPSDAKETGSWNAARNGQRLCPAAVVLGIWSQTALVMMVSLRSLLGTTAVPVRVLVSSRVPSEDTSVEVLVSREPSCRSERVISMSIASSYGLRMND